jgi:hypothetical protein
MVNIQEKNIFKKRINIFAFPESTTSENEEILDQWDLNIFEKNEF